MSLATNYISNDKGKFNLVILNLIEELGILVTSWKLHHININIQASLSSLYYELR